MYRGVPHRGVPRCTEVYRGVPHRGVPRCIEVYPIEVYRGVPRCIEVYPIEVYRGVPRCIEVYPIEVYRGVPRCIEVSPIEVPNEHNMLIRTTYLLHVTDTLVSTYTMSTYVHGSGRPHHKSAYVTGSSILFITFLPVSCSEKSRSAYSIC